MDIYEKILVVFLATALAVLIVVAIVVLLKVMELIKKVDAVTDKAGNLVDKASNVGQLFKQFGGPLVVGRFIASKLRSKKSKRG